MQSEGHAVALTVEPAARIIMTIPPTLMPASAPLVSPLGWQHAAALHEVGVPQRLRRGEPLVGRQAE